MYNNSSIGREELSHVLSRGELNPVMHALPAKHKEALDMVFNKYAALCVCWFVWLIDCDWLFSAFCGSCVLCFLLLLCVLTPLCASHASMASVCAHRLAYFNSHPAVGFWFTFFHGELLLSLIVQHGRVS